MTKEDRENCSLSRRIPNGIQLRNAILWNTARRCHYHGQWIPQNEELFKFINLRESIEAVEHQQQGTSETAASPPCNNITA